MVIVLSKDVGMVIRKSIAVQFLPCLVTFWDSIPTCSFIFLNVFPELVSAFFGGERRVCTVV